MKSKLRKVLSLSCSSGFISNLEVDSNDHVGFQPATRALEIKKNRHMPSGSLACAQENLLERDRRNNSNPRSVLFRTAEGRKFAPSPPLIAKRQARSRRDISLRQHSNVHSMGVEERLDSIMRRHSTLAGVDGGDLD